MENHSEPNLDTEETKDIPDIVSVISETPSCHLEVDQKNVKVIEELNSQEPSSQTSKGKSSSSVEENPNEIKMQVITSDISTVAAGQLTPVLNEDQKSEVLNKKVSEISGTLAASVLFHVSPESKPDSPEQPQISSDGQSFTKDHKRERPPRKPPDAFYGKDTGPTCCNQDKKDLLVRKCVGLNLVVSVEVNGVKTRAVVDSAAQVTIISEDLKNKITDVLEVTEQILLRGIGNNKNAIPAQKVKGIKIKLGSSTYPWDVYITKMTDPVLLGLDFLVSKKCKVDFVRNEIVLPNEVIVASLKSGNSEEFCNVFKVFASKKSVIPPFTRRYLPVEVCSATSKDANYVVEPRTDLDGMLFPTSIITAKGYIEVMNNTNHNAIIKFQQLLGTAIEMEDILSHSDTVDVSPTKNVVAATALSTTLEMINHSSVGNICSDSSSVAAAELSPELLSEQNTVPISDTRATSEISEKDTVAASVLFPVSSTEIEFQDVAKQPTNQKPLNLEQITLKMPDHLKELFEATKNGPPKDCLCAIGNLLIDYQDTFAKHDLDLGCLSVIKHRIDTKDAHPVKQRIRRTPLGFEGEERKHLDKMLAAGVIRPSQSEWASAPVLIRKKDGTVRWCIDYRALNDKTVKDQYPLPLIEDCLDTLSGTEYFSTLDLASGYYQIELEEESMKKTAFITKYGLFEHTRMGFGLCNAPATFQRAMNHVLRGLTWTEVLVYIDDVIVLGASIDEHLASLRRVFERIRTYNLKLKPRKCELLKSEVVFLGKQVTKSGMSITSSKKDAIIKWPTPRNKKELESFLGYANYHRSHVQGYAGITACLYDLAKVKSTFDWRSKHQETFDHLKQLLIKAPCLAFPRKEGTFILDCDASFGAIGAELSQIQDGQERTISFASLVLTAQQRKYCTTRKELLAVVRFCREFRHYLLGRPFLVRTDHNSLAWLMRFKLIEGQLARWLEELAQYDLKILHRPGNKHSNADGLSRIPDTLSPCDCYTAGTKIEDLPCGGCHYCERAYNQWSRFEEDVDDVLPLAIKSPYKFSDNNEDLVKRPADLKLPDYNELHSSSEVKTVKLPALANNQANNDLATKSEIGETHNINWMDTFSKEEICKLQKDDSDIGPVIKWIQESDCPYLGKAPADVIPAARELASIKQMTVDAVLAHVNRNTEDLYGFSG